MKSLDYYETLLLRNIATQNLQFLFYINHIGI